MRGRDRLLRPGRFLLEVTAGQVTLTVEAHGTAGLLDILLPADTPIRS